MRRGQANGGAGSGRVFPILSSSPARLCSRDFGFRGDTKGSFTDGHSVAPALTQLRVREPRDRGSSRWPDVPRWPPLTGDPSCVRAPVSPKGTWPTGLCTCGARRVQDLGVGVCAALAWAYVLRAQRLGNNLHDSHHEHCQGAAVTYKALT